MGRRRARRFFSALIALSALLLVTSCVAVPLFKVEIIQFDTASNGTFVGATITFRVTFDNGDSYLWDFGDGSTGVGQVTSHSYSAEGTYTVRLQIITGARTLTGSQVIVIRQKSGAPDLPTYAYVLNNNDQVDVIDLATGTIITSMGVDIVNVFRFDLFPYMAITPDGTKGYVIHNSDNAGSPDAISVLDLVNNVNTFSSIPLSEEPNGITMGPNGTYAYLPTDDANVLVLDVASDTIVDTIALNVSVGGSGAELVGIHPSGTLGYVYVEGDDDMSIINLETNTDLNLDFQVGTPGDNSTHTAIAFRPNGTRAYLSGIDGPLMNSVVVLNLVNNSVQTVIPIPTSAIGLTGIAVHPDGTRAYVIELDGGVSVIDLDTNTIDTTIPTGTNPIGIAINSDGTRAYVPNFLDDDISMLDLTNNTNLNTDIPVAGTSPFQIIIRQ